jgi:beta-lactamase class D
MRRLVFLYTFSFFLIVDLKYSTAQSTSRDPDLFSKNHVTGSVTVFDLKNQSWHFSDSIDARRPSLPASTFKIINTLIALNTGALKDENEVIRFKSVPDTVLFGFRPETYHDMALDEAFKKSVVWYYYELAERIGKKTYRKYLRKADYGNGNLTQPGTDFWNFGDFAISPVEQINFLVAVYKQRKPFSKRSYEILKDVMLHEETGTYKIYAKTGWERNAKEDNGWWVGYIVTEKNTIFFATRITKPRQAINKVFSSLRKKLTMEFLNSLGYDF